MSHIIIRILVSLVLSRIFTEAICKTFGGSAYISDVHFDLQMFVLSLCLDATDRFESWHTLFKHTMAGDAIS